MNIDHWKKAMMEAWPAMPLAAWEQIERIAHDVEKQAITENLGGSDAVRKLFGDAVDVQAKRDAQEHINEVRSRFGHIDRCLRDIAYNAEELLKQAPR